MSMASSSSTRIGNMLIRHVRPPHPLEFPDEEDEDVRVPEGKLHVLMKAELFYALKRAFEREHTIGCDQFIYFNAKNPRRRCAPDGFVKLGTPDFIFRSWKTWQHGAPDLAVEIDCEHDGKRHSWKERFDRLWQVGVREIVQFLPEAKEGARLRAWDRIDDDLVEREVEGDVTPCVTLDLWWVVRPIGEVPLGLRVARDPAGRDLLLSPLEASEQARSAVESRVAELEAEMRRK
jgi:hypothetical protein